MEISHPVSNKVIQKVQVNNERRAETVEAFSKLHEDLRELATVATPIVEKINDIKEFQRKVDEKFVGIM